MIFECDISRTDAIYEDIEDFQDYETTYSLAYEMVVRNKEVISILENMESLTTEGKEEYSNIPNSDSVSFTMHGYTPDLDSDKLIKLKERYWELYAQLHKNFYFRLDETHLLRNREIILSERISTDGPKLSIDQQIHEMAESIGGSKYRIFHPIYNTRQPSVPSKESKVKALEIDFALPEEEITAQILAVKRIYNELYPPVPLPLDIKNKNENIYDFKTKLFNNNKVFGIEYPVKTKQQTYADAFFIYDVLASKGLEDKKAFSFIRDEIKGYYTDIVMDINSDKFEYVKIENSDKRIKVYIKERKSIENSIVDTYKDTMIDRYTILLPFIEDLKYKQLLT